MEKSIGKDIKWLLNYMASVFMYAIIVILIIIGILLLLYFIDLKTKENKADWVAPLYGAYVIVSGSMKPIIKVHDAVIIKRADEILKVYENKERKRDIKIQESLPLDEIITESKDSKIIEQLSKINILETSPIDALNILYNLKNDLNEIKNR